MFAGIPDYQSLDDRFDKLSVVGCAAGVGRECIAAQLEDHSIVPRRMLCDLELACEPLGAFYAQQGQKELARNAYELACQYGMHPVMGCLDLAARYLSHTFEEPVHGRAQALLDFACPLYSAGPVLQDFPQCLQARTLKP